MLRRIVCNSVEFVKFVFPEIVVIRCFAANPGQREGVIITPNPRRSNGRRQRYPGRDRLRHAFRRIRSGQISFGSGCHVDQNRSSHRIAAAGSFRPGNYRIIPEARAYPSEGSDHSEPGSHDGAYLPGSASDTYAQRDNGPKRNPFSVACMDHSNQCPGDNLPEPSVFLWSLSGSRSRASGQLARICPEMASKPWDQREDGFADRRAFQEKSRCQPPDRNHHSLNLSKV